MSKGLRLNSDAEFAAYVAERPALAQRNRAKTEVPTRKELETKVIRQSKRLPNSTEKRFELEKLLPGKMAGEVLCYEFEAITLRLANGLKYTPDFWMVNGNGETVFIEIKGARPRQREAGIAVLKMAAAKFPSYIFYIAKYANGKWLVQRVLA